MTLADWRDVVLLTLGFVLSIGAGHIGAYIQRRVDQRLESRPLNRLLNFGRDDLLFVFPRRNEPPEAILPRTSTEDFLAINNVISCLLNISWTRKTGVRDVGPTSDDMEHVHTADKRRNLVVICSTKSNALAAEFQKELRHSYANAFTFETEDGQVFIKDGRGAAYRSPSYKQYTEYRSSGVKPRELAGKRLEDYALVTKVTNPWNEHNKVVWIAGIRGIGTWGAAECLKKEWRQIYKRLPENSKAADFAALLKVYYDNCDITSVEVCRVGVLGKQRAV